MNILNKKNATIITSLLICSVIISCESNFNDVQKMGISEFTPSGEAESLNLKYTDSGKITANLISPKMLDYANISFPFVEFPIGMHLTLYDKEGKETYIDAKHATSHNTTNIIDLEGDVKISNQNGEVLETEQLYYDQKNEWFFTSKKFKFTSPKGVSYGEGIDFSKDFKKVNSQKISGQIESE